VSAFLDEMASASRARVRAARERRPEGALEETARATPAPPALRLAAGGFDLIAELKLRSPAAGALATAGARDLDARVAAYARAGAAAVSVLTEPSRFDGSLEHLQRAARTLAPLGVPVMRKDFLVDPYQVLEARAAGAGGVLVIVRMLSRSDIEALLECARTHGLFVLLEAFDARDIEVVHELLAAGRPGPLPLLLAGVNCRDLATLEVVPDRLVELAPLLPQGVPTVAESGVASAADARQVAAAGYALALVGSALMQGSDPQALAAGLLAAGRAARQGH
jgi:indole-3-glycerol phosphate synthase